MAYEPTIWSSGDTVTAEKLNKIEQGIVNGSSGTLAVTATTTAGESILDKTWQEIYDAFPNVYFTSGAMGKGFVKSVYYDDNDRYLVWIDSNAYSASSPTGYPSYLGGTVK